MNLIWLLFGFGGRFNLAKFWLTIFVYLGVEFALSRLIDALAAGGDEFAIYADLSSKAAGFILIAAILSIVAAGVKRLHDRNKSGLWLLAFYFAPIALLGGVASYYFRHCATPFWEPCSWLATTGPVGVACEALAIAFGLWGFVELGCFRGSVGPNRYGPDPLDEGERPET